MMAYEQSVLAGREGLLRGGWVACPTPTKTTTYKENAGDHIYIYNNYIYIYQLCILLTPRTGMS